MSNQETAEEVLTQQPYDIEAECREATPEYIPQPSDDDEPASPKSIVMKQYAEELMAENTNYSPQSPVYGPGSSSICSSDPASTPEQLETPRAPVKRKLDFSLLNQPPAKQNKLSPKYDHKLPSVLDVTPIKFDDEPSAKGNAVVPVAASFFDKLEEPLPLTEVEEAELRNQFAHFVKYFSIKLDAKAMEDDFTVDIKVDFKTQRNFQLHAFDHFRSMVPFVHAQVEKEYPYMCFLSAELPEPYDTRVVLDSDFKVVISVRWIPTTLAKQLANKSSSDIFHLSYEDEVDAKPLVKLLTSMHFFVATNVVILDEPLHSTYHKYPKDAKLFNFTVNGKIQTGTLIEKPEENAVELAFKFDVDDQPSKTGFSDVWHSIEKTDVDISLTINILNGHERKIDNNSNKKYKVIANNYSKLVVNYANSDEYTINTYNYALSSPIKEILNISFTLYTRKNWV
jgi:hypothetical protein